MIVGEQRPFIAALAVVNRDALVEAAKKIGLDGAPEALVAAPPMREVALNHIRRAVAAFSRLRDAAPSVPDARAVDRRRRADDADAEAEAPQHRDRLRRPDRGDVRQGVRAQRVQAHTRIRHGRACPGHDEREWKAPAASSSRAAPIP